MDILKIIKNFLRGDEYIAYKRYGNGHINSTFLVYTNKHETYVLQRINHHAFKDVDLLMSNIHEATQHLANKNIESIQMLPALDGKYYIEQDGEFFRMYQFIQGTLTFEKPEGLKTVEDAAKAFGKFHNNLSDLDSSKLGETIVNFHNTPVRYNNLLKAIELDKFDRVKEVLPEIENIKKYSSLYGLITEGIASGEVKLHITHNDPKINNALFDKNTKDFRSIIDLDTVMPGSVLYDFGDALRSLFTGDREDSLDYKAVTGNYEIYKHYLSAYFAETKTFLTKREKELFPYAPFLLTMECGIRFLEDYLNGDIYFHTTREKHNLDRARTQINLASSIIEDIESYKKITNEIVGE